MMADSLGAEQPNRIQRCLDRSLRGHQPVRTPHQKTQRILSIITLADLLSNHSQARLSSRLSTLSMSSPSYSAPRHSPRPFVPAKHTLISQTFPARRHSHKDQAVLSLINKHTTTPPVPTDCLLVTTCPISDELTDCSSCETCLNNAAFFSESLFEDTVAIFTVRTPS